MKCERCPNTSTGFELFDYCATCGRNLCRSCFAGGCCGAKPAASGQSDDDTPPCSSCGRLMGHEKTCPKKPRKEKG
jgi:hypothetical protein